MSSPRLHVLVTAQHLAEEAGSETFTFTLVDHLIRAGHGVTAYSPHLGRVASRLRGAGARVVRSLRHVAAERFDVAHAQHSTTAIEVRHTFPELPIVFCAHGVLPFLEQPPAVAIGVTTYLAVSEEVRDHLAASGIEPSRIVLFRNVVDSRRFAPRAPLSERPRRALLLSNRIDARRKRVIHEACRAREIELLAVGGAGTQVENAVLPVLLNEADVVFSLGRGVIESMMCARIPIVFDYRGGDGMVMPENVRDFMRCNFSGRARGLDFDAAALECELDRYRPGDGPRLREIALSEFDAATRIPVVLDVYRDAIARGAPSLDARERRIVSFVRATLEVTRAGAKREGETARQRERRAPTAAAAPRPASLGTRDLRAELQAQLAWAPRDVALHEVLGTLAEAEGDYPAALSHACVAMELDPLEPHVRDLLNRASIHVLRALLADARRVQASFAERDDLRREGIELRAELYVLRARLLVARAVRAGCRRLFVYGAGPAGQALVTEACRADVVVEGVVDRNPELHGTSVGGVEVIGLDRAMSGGVDAYAIASVAHAGAIEADLARAYKGSGRQPRIFIAESTMGYPVPA